MEHEIPEFLLWFLRAGATMGVGYILCIPIALIDLIMQLSLEKRRRRKTVIGKLNAREYKMLEQKIIENNKIKENVDFEDVGRTLYALIVERYENIQFSKQHIRKLIDKINIFKRKGE